MIFRVFVTAMTTVVLTWLAANAKAPEPVAGTVPLSIEDVVEAEGPNLHIEDYELDLVGKRVRFVAEVDDVDVTSAGEHFIAMEGEGERVVLALQAPIVDRRVVFPQLSDAPATVAQIQADLLSTVFYRQKGDALVHEVRPRDQCCFRRAG